MSTALDRICEAFHTLSPDTLARLDQLYAPDARFRDPFNDVRGLDAIRRIFEHMFATLEQPRFRITGSLQQGSECFVRWEFRFRFRSFRRDVEQCIEGASHLQLDAQGRITLHRDYWDAAEELYEKLPAVGALMRWLRARVMR